MTLAVKDVMSRDAVALREATPFERIVWTLKHFGTPAVPVVDAQGRVVGMVSEDDLLIREWTCRPTSGKALGRIAADLMRTPAVTVDETTPVREAARLMHRTKTRQLPVVDSSTGRLRGMLTRSALLRAFTRSGATVSTEIRRRVLPRVLGQDAGKVDVSVQPGRVVTLRGSVPRSAQVDALVDAVKRIEGVAAVHAFVEVLDDDA